MNKIEEMLDLLTNKHISLGSVESLTSGLFASSVASIPGASNSFKGSLVTYSSLLKTSLAHVPLKDITQFGVVSKEVAIDMAMGGKKALDVDLCVSCTGNAGPTCCPGDAPVGRVYIAIDYLNKTDYLELNLSGDRNNIRQQVVEKMVDLVINCVK